MVHLCKFGEIHPLIQEISYIQDFDLENRIKVPNKLNSLDCPKGKAVLDWWESSQRLKKYINFSEVFTYLTPPVTLKMRSRSLKSNQLFSLSLWYICVIWRKSIYWFKRYPTYKTMTLKMGSRSSRTLHVLTLSQRYIHSSLMNIHPFVQEISHF